MEALCQSAIVNKDEYQTPEAAEGAKDNIKKMAGKWMALDTSPFNSLQNSSLDHDLVLKLTEIGSILGRSRQRLSEGLESPGRNIGVGHVMVAAGEELAPKVKKAFESIWKMMHPGSPGPWEDPLVEAQTEPVR